MEFEDPCFDLTSVNQSSHIQQQTSQQESLHPLENLSQKNLVFNNSQIAQNQQSEELQQFPNGENIENDESSMQEIQLALIPLKFKSKEQSEAKADQLKKIRNNDENSNENNIYSHDSSSSKITSSPLSADHLLPKILNKKITSLNEKFKKRKQDQMIAYQQKINKLNHLIQGRRATRFNPKQAIGVPIDFFQTIQCTYEFQIFGGISISTDYSDNLIDPDTNERKPVVKCQNSMPCGATFPEARVIFNKSLNTVEILSAPCFIGSKEFSALCEIFDSFNDMDYHLLSNTLKRYQNEVYKIVKNNKISQNIPSRIYAEIEEDYQSFVEWAKQQVLILTKDKPFFKYVIGRMNYNLGDMQITNIGASIEFTKILGMDYEIFAQSVLRGQFCELGKIMGSNIEQAIYQLLKRIENQDLLPEQTILLNTIDGFTMTSKQTLVKIPSPFTRHLISEYDHLFYLELVNVEENQLKALVEFRQRQLDHQKGISFEQYAHRELSQFFEIVEYSVYSQIFLEKYYSKKE